MGLTLLKAQGVRPGNYMYDVHDQLKRYVYSCSEKYFAKGDADRDLLKTKRQIVARQKWIRKVFLQSLDGLAYLRDVKQEELNTWEPNPLLSPNTTGPMLCSDGIGSVGDKISLKNCWCAGNSQEFDQVSPAMWEEFCLDYQRPIFERFGYVCYGCCENLTHKIDGVLSIPNLRIFVCSAWTDIDVVLNKINKNYCIMWRQKASDVVCTDDLKTLRNQMEEGLRKLQGQYYQIVLRELQTLAGNLDRLHVWTAMAKELAAKYA